MQAQPFSYTIDAFTDPEGQPLTYTAELEEDGGALPSVADIRPDHPHFHC